MRKVLIANRGEIAVRVVRACRDAGLGSVAVYAEPDLDALHVRMADEAYALAGATSQETYLDIDKIIKVGLESGADAIHPGYGFLAENAGFARAVTAAGLTWIGPPPQAIEALGDKVKARHIALEAGAPLTPGTPDPVSGAAEVQAFAREYGYPVAIKAAFGGGGRGLKVAWREEEVPDLFESAVREATAAFGRGECFVERYLDRPRHVETQCLADAHGHVVVVSTRDCSLQRRHQKLVEEAPAPFLSAAQTEALYRSSKDILRLAGYVGAGTCEFLVGQDGTVSFLEVNTRLQVEHPVSEEVTGIDLVREMFRIAEGEPLGYDDPPARGHSIEFRINAEDPARNFLPAPGTITTWNLPSGPGVRVDAGYRGGMTVPQVFDSLIAKLIVTGASRAEALQRSARALAEFEVGGMPTVLPFHRAVRALDRVPDQRRGPGPQLPARPGHHHHLERAGRARRAGRQRVRGRDDDPAGIRLADRQADRDRREPGRGAAAFGPRPGRVRGRRDAHRAALPPGRGRGPRVHRRAAAGAHPLDRDRIRRAHAGPGDRRGGVPAGPGKHYGRGGREAARGGGTGRPGQGGPKGRPGGWVPPGQQSQAVGARRQRRHAGQPHAGHDHQDRRGGGAAGLGRRRGGSA